MLGLGHAGHGLIQRGRGTFARKTSAEGGDGSLQQKGCRNRKKGAEKKTHQKVGKTLRNSGSKKSKTYPERIKKDSEKQGGGRDKKDDYEKGLRWIQKKRVGSLKGNKLGSGNQETSGEWKKICREGKGYLSTQGGVLRGKRGRGP